MNLTEIPMGEVVAGIERPSPNTKKARLTNKWARFAQDMKVGDCVRLASAKEKNAMKSYFYGHKIGCQTLGLGDGTYVVWRVRWPRK